MLEALSSREKGVFAEDRAFRLYGGMKHPRYGGTIPDLVREHDGKTEVIEVKYMDLDAYTIFADRLYRTKSQLKNRRQFIPKEAIQRVYILCDNPEKFGWSDEEIMETVMYVFNDFDVLVDVEVLRDNANEPPES